MAKTTGVYNTVHPMHCKNGAVTRIVCDIFDSEEAKALFELAGPMSALSGGKNLRFFNAMTKMLMHAVCGTHDWVDQPYVNTVEIRGESRGGLVAVNQVFEGRMIRGASAVQVRFMYPYQLLYFWANGMQCNASKFPEVYSAVVQVCAEAGWLDNDASKEIARAYMNMLFGMLHSTLCDIKVDYAMTAVIDSCRTFMGEALKASHVIAVNTDTLYVHKNLRKHSEADPKTEVYALLEAQGVHTLQFREERDINGYIHDEHKFMLVHGSGSKRIFHRGMMEIGEKSFYYKNHAREQTA